MTNWLNRSNVLRCMSVLFGIWLLAATAAAQAPGGERPRGAGMGMAGTSMERLLRPDFQARDLAIISRQLELDHSQRPIFEMLLEDYREAFRDAAYELDRALRHLQLQQIEDRMEQQMDRVQGRTPLDEIRGRDAVRARDVAEQVVMHVDPAVRQRVVIEPLGDGSVRPMVAFSTSDGAGLSVELVDDGPYTQRRRVIVTSADDDADADSEEASERAARVQERIERMRERIRERMERRIEQQREEMRQRGIDPDEMVEPMEPDEIAELAKSFLAEKQRLRTRFESDAHMLLSPRQREMLPEVLRIIRRLNALPDSRLSGEQLDLVRILDDEHLLSRHDADLEFVLDEYSAALDTALTDRVRYLEQSDIEQFRARHHGDHETLLTLVDNEMRRRVAVRQVNESFAERIAATLRESQRERFESAVEAQAFPQVVRATSLERLLPIVHEHHALTDEQRVAVEHLAAQHASVMAEHRREMIQTIRQREVEQPRQMLAFAQRLREVRDSGENPHDVNWSELRPPTPVQFTTRFSHFQVDQSFYEQLQGAVPGTVLETIAEDNDSARTALEVLNRPRPSRGFERRRERR